jgi:hypothetical protein
MYLCRGFAYFLREPFADESKARECWAENREQILSLRDRRDDVKPGAYYRSGTRPWCWWKFQHGKEPPSRQSRLIERALELQPGERAAALELAKEQWTRCTLGWTTEANAEAALITDEALLDAWPSLPDDDGEG